MDAQDLDYALPDALIAQAPLADRAAARMLWLHRHGHVEHRHIRELPSLLSPSLIVLNDTRVLPARLLGQKASGGKVEMLLVERVSVPGISEQWRVLAKPHKSLREGTVVAFGAGELHAEINVFEEGGTLLVTLRAEAPIEQVLERVGALPLPPYIRRAAALEDATRYQTVFARESGAVAAPTAGLHFDDALLEALRAAGHELAFVTLHVGLGTFAPLRSDNLDEHVMHFERYTVPDATVAAVAHAKQSGRKVLAVGTTVVRTLESNAATDGTLRGGSGRTDLFIRPPYDFRVVDRMLTNFHLPRTTLLALVMAFGGTEAVRAAYLAAVQAQYRFFSYGDAMLVSE
jgi:S-adenosylmethionine:tRNA ribosyltransferase-isomerase